MANLAKHGVDFADVDLLEWRSATFIDQTVGNEKRTLSYVPISNRVFAVVFTMRGNVTRIISFRKANQREVRRYVESQKPEEN